MQNLTRIALGLGAAAVVASGGSAFTAASSVTETQTRLGYGTHDISGVTVTNIAYVPSSDVEYLDKIVFTLDGTTPVATTHVAELALNSKTATPFGCTILTTTSIECDFATDPTINLVEAIFLVVRPGG